MHIFQRDVTVLHVETHNKVLEKSHLQPFSLSEDLKASNPIATQEDK